MNNIIEIMYFETFNNRIKCTSTTYSEEQIENTTTFFYEKKFKIDKKIIKMSVNEKTTATYIMLENGVVLVFKDKTTLKNEIFKPLVKELKITYLKYKLKKVTNEINYTLHKNIDLTKNKAKKIATTTKYVLCKNINSIDSKKVSTAISLTAILMTETVVISIGNAKINNSINNKKVIVDDDSKIQTASLEEILSKNVNFTFESYKAENKFISFTSNTHLETSESSNSSETNDNLDSNNNSSETNDNLDSNNNSSESNITIENNNVNSLVYYDNATTPNQIANTFKYYSGDVYENFVAKMNNPQITSELNRRIGIYVSQNLEGKKMWGNAYGQGYDNYTIPDKFKNGEFTLNELFDAASNEFGVPKDILVSISQHECSQAYLIKNSYTGVYEKNCGGMMGHVNLYGMNKSHLPNGGYDGCDVTTNPAISIYSYASAIKFFHDNFKDIDIGYGLDSWDISSYMIALGLGNVTDPNIGFKYRYDYDVKGVSQLNECVPQFKALREAYLNNELGVNDLTFTVKNGVVTHWIDGEKFYYKNGEFTFEKHEDSYSYRKKH